MRHLFHTLAAFGLLAGSVAFSSPVMAQEMSDAEQTTAADGEAANDAVIADAPAVTLTDIDFTLPPAGKVEFSLRDLVLQADFESYAAAAAESQEQGADAANGEGMASHVVFHPSDIFDLHNMAMGYVNEHFAEDAIAPTAAFLFEARTQGLDKRLTLDEEARSPVLEAISDKGYDVEKVDFENMVALKDFYLEKRAQRMDKKQNVVQALFDNLAIVDFIKFDQESRVCDRGSAEKNEACAAVKKDLIAVLDKPSFQDHCHATALRYISSNLSVDETEYAAAYHEVVDHKAVKFIVDQRNYDREELREYMDGALMQLDKKGFSPHDREKMQVAQAIRPQIMKLCVSLLGQHTDETTNE